MLTNTQADSDQHAGVTAFAAKVGHQPITGLLRATSQARGLVIALHGGGYDATYWHPPHPDLSLLNVGHACGFNVLSINRPGYLGSMTSTAEGMSLDDQAKIVFDLIDELVPAEDQPVFLIGHSMGGILSLIMAAHPRSARLSAIDVSGIPLRYPPEMQPFIEASMQGVEMAASDSGDERRRWMFYGADGTFDPNVAAAVPGANAVPIREIRDAFSAPVVLPPLLETITLPVQWTIADQERSSVGGEPMLDVVRSLLSGSRYVRTSLQLASGHNISHHHVGRAYHLRALGFFDEVNAVFDRTN
ncbi:MULTISPECIES: alpha/beta hydrolase [unclassified Sphingobium]|uniref:alpha/beta hydrolase n=1 Tax=unclassified Sphingobium TaxID=2611147 RepID=UPI00119C3547|nr:MULTISPECIES: alpha/beta hydrolase [unclassified Sphingobium]TWC97604.1 alpha/beta hydrolase family protein [Sphingobium sp. AEW010]TWD17797.1 alpha/beta hydrolase family protein [Sphingobium sp. AEW013]TWD20043.1 alpha/beta hydrolase family protein [Sphingobium sp. AEW001]